MVTELEKLGFSRSKLSPTVKLTAQQIINQMRGERITKDYLILSPKIKRRRFSITHILRREFFANASRYLEDKYIRVLITPFKNMDHFEANRQISRNAKTWFWRKVLFGYKRSAFFKWQQAYSPYDPDPETSFSISVFDRFLSVFSTYLRTEDIKTKNLFETYRDNPSAYWRSFYNHVINTPPQALTTKFLTSGLALLEEAFREGKGVILLSHHGGPRVPYFFPLERYFGLDTIPVISYKVPLSNEDNVDKSLSQTNAEILLQAFEALSKGEIIKIFPDTDDKTGELHAVTMLHRRFMIKAGFAELALRSGAPIIPTDLTIDPSGAIIMNFYPALKVNGDDHIEKVANLLKQYAEFVDSSYAANPGSIVWKKYEDLDKIPMNR